MDYGPWIGRSTTAADTLDPGPARRLAAVLDRDDPEPCAGDPLAPGWQWLYFLAAARAGLLTADGRGTRGDLLPPFAGLRRMWAGGSFAFRRPMCIGETLECATRVAAIEAKEGRGGPLIVANLEHRFADVLVEEQHLVFRPAETGAAIRPGEPAPATAAWRRSLVPDPVLLFRFSALTFNAHRIHYDERYTREVEGYPGLLVHGPLTALLLLDLLRRHLPTRTLVRFDYRALRPLYAERTLTLCGAPRGGDGVMLWAEDDTGALAMRAEATLA